MSEHVDDRELAEAKEVVTATARRLQARLDEAEARLRALEERERELERRERRLEERERTSAKAHEAAPERPPATPSQAEPAAEAATVVPVGDGRFNVLRLEALVERAAQTHPERIEQWRSYVFFLRGHADTDGNLPPSFHHLVEEVFGELL